MRLTVRVGSTRGPKKLWTSERRWPFEIEQRGLRLCECGPGPAGLEELLDEKVGEENRDASGRVKDDDASSLNTALAQENPAAYSHRHHYVSGLIARLISNKAPSLARAKDFASLSTPSQLKAFYTTKTRRSTGRGPWLVLRWMGH